MKENICLITPSLLLENLEFTVLKIESYNTDIKLDKVRTTYTEGQTGSLPIGIYAVQHNATQMVKLASVPKAV